jgi:hypothetical protein
LEFAIPISWRVKMAEHAFIPIEHEVPDIVDFCERLEFTENATRSISNLNSNNQAQQSQNNKGKNSEKGQQSQDNVGALPQATSKQKTNKHKRPGKVVSFKDSNGNDGCRLHIWATDHTTMECRVIQKQCTIRGMISKTNQNCQKDRPLEMTNAISQYPVGQTDHWKIIYITS